MKLPEYCKLISSDSFDLQRAIKNDDEAVAILEALEKKDIDSLRTVFKSRKVIVFTFSGVNPLYVDFSRACDLFNNYQFLLFDVTLKNKIKSIIEKFSDLRFTHNLLLESQLFEGNRAKYLLDRLFNPYVKSTTLFVKLFKEISDEGKSSSSDGIGIADILAKLG